MSENKKLERTLKNYKSRKIVKTAESLDMKVVIPPRKNRKIQKHRRNHIAGRRQQLPTRPTLSAVYRHRLCRWRLDG